MIACFTAVSAIVPSFLIGWYFHKRDLYPEPGRVLWASFGLGVLTVIAVLPVELAVAWVIKSISPPLLRGGLEAFLVAAVPEEFFKLAVLVGYAARHREFNEPMDGVVYGVMAALGFATLENVLYVAGGGLSTALVRAITAVPAHASTGAILGYFVGRARFASVGKTGLILRGFGWAVLIHGLYDFPLLSLNAAAEAAGGAENVSAGLTVLLLITLAALIFGITRAVQFTRRLRHEQRVSRVAVISAPASTPVSAPRRFWAVVMLVIGFLLAAAGGVMTLGLGLILLLGQVEKESLTDYLVGSAVLGLLPLLLGLVLFGLAIARLNRVAPPPSYYFPPPFPPAAPPFSPAEGLRGGIE